MQKNPDDYHTQHNTKRPQQGRNMKGRTPERACMEGLTKIKKAAKIAAQQLRPTGATARGILALHIDGQDNKNLKEL